MRLLKAIVVTSLCYVAIAPSRALGGLVTWQFAGEITSVTDPDGSLGGVFSIGTPFSGMYTFESTTPDTFPDILDSGLYEGAVTSISGMVGDVVFSAFSSSPGRIYVSDDNAGDGYSVSGATVFLGAPVAFGLRLGDSTGTIFSDNSLPLTPPDLRSLDNMLFLLVLEPDGDALVGELTALVPDPTTLALLVAGALFVIRRKR